jgi:C1A family cysteine protease
MPPVSNQGSQSSCVAFTVAYAARSAEQYYRSGATSYSYSTNIFSPAYLYDQTKATSSCSSGSSLLNALNFVYNSGVCLWQTLPYNASGCTLSPTSAEITEAAKYKIPTYSRMYTSDSTGIKTMLAGNHPLMVSFTADANFYNAGSGYIWNSYSSTLYGPHSVAICGYDDSKHAYLAINSWGTSWGTNGYIWIDYSFLTTISYDLYVMN